MQCYPLQVQLAAQVYGRHDISAHKDDRNIILVEGSAHNIIIIIIQYCPYRVITFGYIQLAQGEKGKREMGGWLGRKGGLRPKGGLKERKGSLIERGGGG